MSNVLMRHNDNFWSVSQGYFGWAGQSDRSAFRQEVLALCRKAAKAAKEIIDTAEAKVLAEVKADIAEKGVSATTERQVIPNAGLGHWEVAKNAKTDEVEIYRVNCNGGENKLTDDEMRKANIYSAVEKYFTQLCYDKVAELLYHAKEHVL